MRTEAKNPQSGKINLTEGFCQLFSCDLAVLPGHPSDLTSDLHSLPAILKCSDPLEHDSIMNSCDAGIINTGSYLRVHGVIVKGSFHLHHGKLLLLQFGISPPVGVLLAIAVIIAAWL